MVRCTTWHHLYNLKNVKNTHRGVLNLVKLQASACNFTKIITPPWVFFTFFKLCKWYQIAQRITNNLLILTTSVDVWVLGLGFLVFINICDASRLMIRSKYVPSIVIASPSSLHWINLSLLTSRIVNASWNKTWWMSINKLNNTNRAGGFYCNWKLKVQINQLVTSRDRT